MPNELEQLHTVVAIWRQHIADVFERRGRSEVYQPNEVFHTCHGCGAGACRLHRGLCEKCQRLIGEIEQVQEAAE